ncbi:MAG TPA: DNA recombination protein RmuC [Terriglobales bacterium]|nr:DNA recombination protein RmuC [Terriglobales bacterium]
MAAALPWLLLGGLAGAVMAWLWQARRVARPDEFAALRVHLEQTQARLAAMERERAGAAARVEMQLQQVAAAGAAMRDEARGLRQALTSGGAVRGAWGEAVLENILRACGLNPGVDYETQVELAGRFRPDVVIHLPSGRKLAVDAKASLQPFLDGLEAAEEGARRAAHAAFARRLRERARELAGKDYAGALAGSLPCVVMFVPSESAFRAACDADPELFAYGQGLQPPVLLASPATLFPLLQVVAQGWQQQRVGEQAHALLGEITELGARLRTFTNHLRTVGAALNDTVAAYNAAGASFRSRLTPQLQRLEQRHAGWEVPDELPEVAAPALPPERNDN